MKHQYKTEIFWKKALRITIDFFVDLFAKFFIKKEKQKKTDNPQKILFITLAQLGDALACSFIFPFLYEKFPNAKIDVLTGEWSKPIFEHNPYVRNIIFFNHFRMNRNNVSLTKKVQIHIKSFRIALKTIRSQQYDLSIEGGITHPNGNILCYRGRINRRVGSGSGGYGALLTDEVSLPSKQNFHILEAVLNVLYPLGIEKQLIDIKPYFKTLMESLDSTHEMANFIDKPFIIIQPESGNIKRTLSKEFWSAVTEKILTLTDYYVIISGTRLITSELVKYISSKHFNDANRIIDAVQKFSIEEFFLFSKYAKAALTLESLPAHLCSINCVTISFYKNGSGVFFFPIPNKKTIVIHNHTLSKDVKFLDKLSSYFVQKIESQETYNLVGKFLKEINS